MHQKVRSAKFKAIDGAESGTFSAVVAVYGNVDTVGDRIVDGAFDASLKAWQVLGDPIPIVLAHEWKDPFAHIGYAMPDKVKSVPGVGLVVEEGHLDMDNPTARQVHRLMSRKTLKEFSFGYGVPQGGQTKASDGAMDLKQLDLIEFGPCLKGVNDKTELLSIKSQLVAERDDYGVPTFEERLERMEAMLGDSIYGKASAGRQRWRSQKRDPNTGKWIDETVGPGFDGKPRKQSSNFSAAVIDRRRAEANADAKVSGSDKYKINSLLNQAEGAFLAGDNDEGEALVREAAIVHRNAGGSPSNPKPGEANHIPYVPSPEDMATPQEVNHVNSTMKEAERLLSSLDSLDYDDQEPVIDQLDEIMGNLHVDMEQSVFPAAVEKKYEALEKEWIDKGEGKPSTEMGPNATQNDVQAMANELGEPVMNPSTGKWVKPKGDAGEEIFVAKEPDPGSEDGYSNAATSAEVNKVNSAMEEAEKWLNSLDDLDYDDQEPVIDQLDWLMGDLHVDMEQAEFPAAVEKKYAQLEKLWIERGEGKPSTTLKRAKKSAAFHGTLDEQLRDMQARTSLMATEAQLERKGMNIRNDSDETLRRLAELEDELG